MSTSRDKGVYYSFINTERETSEERGGRRPENTLAEQGGRESERDDVEKGLRRPSAIRSRETSSFGRRPSWPRPLPLPALPEAGSVLLLRFR